MPFSARLGRNYAKKCVDRLKRLTFPFLETRGRFKRADTFCHGQSGQAIGGGLKRLGGGQGGGQIRALAVQLPHVRRHPAERSR